MLIQFKRSAVGKTLLPISVLGAVNSMEKTKDSVKVEAMNIKPPQCVSHTGSAIVLSFSEYDFSLSPQGGGTEQVTTHTSLVRQSHVIQTSPVLGPRSMVCGPWSVIRGSWSVVHGPWSVVLRLPVFRHDGQGRSQ